MEDTFTNSILTFIIIGVTTMIAFVSLIITYITISQRKSTKQQLKMQAIKNKHQKDLFKSVLATQEKERKRIAKDLHDEIGTSLSAIGLMVSQLKNKAKSDNKELASLIKDNIDGVVIETRRVINDLSPSSLSKFGLFVELDNLANLIHSSANIKLEFDSDIKQTRLSEEVELTLYQIIKEFCNNTIKYAKATKISLSINIKDDENLYVLIKDDGDGFDINAISKGGHGLNNMESRAYLLGGESKLISSLGKGTELEFSLPLKDNDLGKLNSEL